ncbi:SDR family NAD(P)-dependent oxidoreductase [Pseudonocardia sp. WMMC193]|uniref:SDR family NAD(P)-dependent oxidoreductase n=1 Tax=Pseudonocardia sp. WMMC193 TaxID=2911965 RepID=UPI001F38D874|nr:SDR family NAD(P)-dependent oxidoreductase [Pseudonocardia sp. WMMC193]MCF7551704.1 SDR family NAD(P)-dependent oxidoreductase [Pseudonocardia sp. WMMC193]
MTTFLTPPIVHPNTSRFVGPFDRRTTAAEVVHGLDLGGRRAVVTGAASGIGLETARALAAAGACVTLAVRDVDAGAAAATALTAATGNELVSVAPLDLTDRTSIRAFVSTWDGPLHMLVNNAGVMATPLTRTAERWELQFATNHLGHFALTTGLFPALLAAGDARVVSVSSGAHLRAPVDFDDVHFHGRPYDPWLAYAQSKTANVLFAVEANRRWSGDGIHVNAVMPGGIRTGLQRHLDARELAAMDARAGDLWKTAEQGAATSVLLAASPLVEGIGGRYFEDCAEALPATGVYGRGVAPYALNPEAAERLWDLSVATLRA